MEKRRMMTLKEAADKWHVGVKYLGVLCRNGFIKSAVKLGTKWYIPEFETLEEARDEN